MAHVAPKLKAVSFNNCSVKKLPDDLSGWRGLDSLSLGACPIPADEMKRIRSALPKVALMF